MKKQISGSLICCHPELVSGSRCFESGGIPNQVWNNKIMKQNGFTLIELLVVVLIIGILAAVAVPQYRIAVEKSRLVRSITLARALWEANERYYLATGSYTADIDLLDVDIQYSSKSEITTRISYKTSMGTFYMYKKPQIVFSGNGYTVDYYGTHGLCYPHVAGTFGEEVCKRMGKKLERVSSDGTPCYEIQY